jgi:SNF2 family DNA or RNA helicase
MYQIEYEPKTKPYAHQQVALDMSRDREAFALLMEMGTGKTKVIIDTAGHLFLKGKIDAVFVLAPNGVHRDWINEAIPTHMSDQVLVKTAYWSSQATKAETTRLGELAEPFNGLKIYAMNIEALGAGTRAFDSMRAFIKGHRCLMVVDESTRIKSEKANRTKRVLKAVPHAPYRRILTGTPVANNPLDIYTQFKFLGPKLLPYANYWAFRHDYAIMRKMTKVVVVNGHAREKQMSFVCAYKNLEKLAGLIAPHSFRVLAKDCLDLPPVVKSKSSVVMTKDQVKVYNQLKKDLWAELSGQEISTPIMLTKMLRLSQITGGFITYDETTEAVPLPGANPKMNRLEEIVEDLAEDDKVIIWARFTAEIKAIHEMLAQKYGADKCLLYFGEVSDKNKEAARKEFGDPDSPSRFFIGNPAAGGIGLNLTAANVMIYYSTDYDLEKRLQSEKRFDRIGQKRSMTLVDLIAEDSLDVSVHEALANKKDMADVVTRDNLRDFMEGA